MGGEIFTIVMAARVTVHVSFKLTHDTVSFLHTNIPIDDYHSEVSILLMAMLPYVNTSLMICSNINFV